MAFWGAVGGPKRASSTQSASYGSAERRANASYGSATSVEPMRAIRSAGLRAHFEMGEAPPIVDRHEFPTRECFLILKLKSSA